MLRIHQYRLTSIVLAVAILLTAGCRGDKSNDKAATTDRDTKTSAKKNTGEPKQAAKKNSSTIPGAWPTVAVPLDFPSDVPLADYMLCKDVTRVRDDFMISFHAKDHSMDEIVEWFNSGMAKNGWVADGSMNTPTNAILPFNKNGRTCGISIANKTLMRNGTFDEATRHINIQTPAEGASKPVRKPGVSASSESDAGGGR